MSPHIDRCDREITQCEAEVAADHLAFYGELDWRIERAILVRERGKAVVTVAAGKAR